MLENFGIVGISWRQGGSEALAAYALPPERLAERLRRFAKQAALAELAYLETCNRVELVYSSESSQEDIRPLALQLLTGRAAPPGEAKRTLRAWRGEGACEHLFLVAAGLDSAAVGEADVAGQVRASHDCARAWGLAGPKLALLFEEALRLAAAVRDNTRLGTGSISLAEVALGHVRRRLQRNPGLVALVGVSPMTERAARVLADARQAFVVVNRSERRGRAFADRFGARFLCLEDFRHDPPPVAIVFASTGSRRPVLLDDQLQRLAARADGEPPLCVDMAVPADVDPAACAKFGLRRIGMDEITDEAARNRDARLAAVAEARTLVDAALPRLRERCIERLHGNLFATLQEHYRDVASAGVERLAKQLKLPIEGDEREAVERWAQGMAKRLAHVPVVGLKGLLRDGPEGSLDAFLDALGSDLAGRMRQGEERRNGREG